MKHSEETKRKISETLKRKGIKPTVLPTKEQCVKNLGSYIGAIPWNKGKSNLPPSWNAGLYGYMSKEKNGNWKGGLPKCEDCKTELKNRNANYCMGCIGNHRKGENHYNWKGGTGQPERRTGEYKKWRNNVYKRDWFSCQMPSCLYYGKNIEAHHIIPIRENKEKVFDLSNGITLCKSCHLHIRGREELYQNLFNRILSTTAPKGLMVVLEFRLP